METGDIAAMKNWVGVTNEDAKAIDDELRAMQERLRRPPTIEDIEREAKAESSPFHKHLTWDDSQAATAFRRDQVRKVVRAIGYVVGGDNEPIILRAYLAMKPVPKAPSKTAIAVVQRGAPDAQAEDSEDAQAPLPMRRRDEIMADPDLRAQHLRSLVGRLAQYIPELEQFGDETRDLCRAIGRLQQKLEQAERHTATARKLPAVSGDAAVA